MEVYLSQLFYDPKRTGSFSGPEKLYHIVRQEGKYKIGLHKIKRWLQKQDAYSLQRPAKHKFKRNRVIVGGLNDMWDVDLASVENLKKDNDNVIHLLVAIDVFSRYAYVQPLLDKKAVSVMGALKTIFAKGVHPRTIRTDPGSEFRNQYVKKFLKTNNVYYFSTKNSTKANYAERFIRTLRNMMFIYFRSKKTYRYIDVLQDLVSNYNHSPHSSLGNMAPADVDATNESRLWEQLYVDTVKIGQQKPKIVRAKQNKPKFKFKVGALVRISHLKTVFRKDYQQKWTSEIFKVASRRYKQNIPVYYLVDFHNEPIEGSFYSSELQRVEKDQNSLWDIDQLIRKRRHKGKTQWLVSFIGWPAKFNEWINAEDIKPAEEQT